MESHLSSPSHLWEWPFSSQGAPQLSPARLPLHPLHAFVHLVLSLFVYWQNQSPLHDLGANISFTDQDLQQPQLGLNLLVFIVFFSHRSAVFFLHVPSGSESRSWGFLQHDIFPQQPPSVAQDDLKKQLLSSTLHQGTKPNLLSFEREKNQPNNQRTKNRGANKLLQESMERLHIEAEHNPMVPNAKPYLKHALLLWNCQPLQNSWKTFQEPSERQLASMVK